MANDICSKLLQPLHAPPLFIAVQYFGNVLQSHPRDPDTTFESIFAGSSYKVLHRSCENMAWHEELEDEVVDGTTTGVSCVGYEDQKAGVPTGIVWSTLCAKFMGDCEADRLFAQVKEDRCLIVIESVDVSNTAARVTEPLYCLLSQFAPEPVDVLNE